MRLAPSDSYLRTPENHIMMLTKVNTSIICGSLVMNVVYLRCSSWVLPKRLQSPAQWRHLRIFRARGSVLERRNPGWPGPEAEGRSGTAAWTSHLRPGYHRSLQEPGNRKSYYKPLAGMCFRSNTFCLAIGSHLGRYLGPSIPDYLTTKSLSSDYPHCYKFTKPNEISKNQVWMLQKNWMGSA